MDEEMTREIRCECDYDAQGDPLEYVKVTHDVCPLHDDCTRCLEKLGTKRSSVPGEWLCDECESELARLYPEGTR